MKCKIDARGCITKYTPDEGETDLLVPEYIDSTRVTIIGDSVFLGRKDLRSVCLPPGTTEIGRYAFGGCRDLSLVKTSDSLTHIHDFAFSDTPLVRIEIPRTVQMIGRNAFHNCTNLESIFVENESEVERVRAFLSEDLRARVSCRPWSLLQRAWLGAVVGFFSSERRIYPPLEPAALVDESSSFKPAT